MDSREWVGMFMDDEKKASAISDGKVIRVRAHPLVAMTCTDVIAFKDGWFVPFEQVECDYKTDEVVVIKPKLAAFLIRAQKVLETRIDDSA